MSDADSVSSSVPRRAAPPAAAEDARAPKRSRRAASVVAMRNLSTDPKTLLESLREIKPSADTYVIECDITGEEEEEERSDGAQDAPARAQHFAKRMEDEVNRLKKCAKEDKTIVDSLKSMVTTLIGQLENKPASYDDGIARVTTTATPALTALAEILIKERQMHQSTKALLDMANRRLEDLHAAFVPQCLICKEHKPTLPLHEGHVKHNFCMDCITTLVTSNRIVLARQGFLKCPLCAEHFTKIPSFDIQTLSTGDIDAWRVDAKRDSLEETHLDNLDMDAHRKLLVGFWCNVGVQVDNKVMFDASAATRARVERALHECIVQINRQAHAAVPDGHEDVA